MSVEPIVTWTKNNLDAQDPALRMTASIMWLNSALNDFAGVQVALTTHVNGQVTGLSNAMNLLRTYTPEGDQSGTTTPNGIDTTLPQWSGPTANQDLYTIISCLQQNNIGADYVSLFTIPGSTTLCQPGTGNMDWTTAEKNDSDLFSQAGMQALGQTMQALNTQMTTQVQTLTSEAGQTNQLANTMSQAASSLLANWLQNLLAAAKA
jgi:hypothetical protein